MARKEIIYELEAHSPIPYPEIDGWDEDIVETAGFIPLEVRFKQMEQAGIRAQFFENEFSSKDVQDMYLNHPEFDLTPEDEIEEALEKIRLRQDWIAQVKAAAQSRAKAEQAGTEQPQKKSDKTVESEEK